MKEQVAEIVAAYLRKNTVAPSEVPAFVMQVYQSFAALGQSPAEPPEGVTPNPAVSIRRSVADDAITCLECGAKGMMMRRRLKNRPQSDTRGISPTLEPAGELPDGRAKLRGPPVGARQVFWPWEPTDHLQRRSWVETLYEGPEQRKPCALELKTTP